MEQPKPNSQKPSFPFTIPRFLREVLKSIEDPVNVIDREYRVLWTNEFVLKHLGVGIDQVRGRICYELYFRRDRVCDSCPVQEVFASSKACVKEKWIAEPKGAGHWREVHAYPVHDESGEILWAVRIGFDITERKRRQSRRTRYIEALENALKEATTGLSRRSPADDDASPSDLTDRELEVLGLMAEGLTNAQIARVLCVSPHTVKSHAVHIFNKLGVNDRTQAAVKAARLNLI